MHANQEPPSSAWRRFRRALGPGLTSGAADDDPSGVTTYSIAGAQAGLALLWTALLSWPLMACVQMMCARIGMVTGMGLAGALRQKFPRGLVAFAALTLLIANTINIASDLTGMADAAEMLTGVSSHVFVVAFGALICYATIRLRYHQIAGVLRWLAVFLFSYVVAGFAIRPEWGSVFEATFVPHWPQKGEWGLLVAIFGTTISPYLFFWQAGQEVEEEKAKGRRLIAARQGATPRELADRRIDVGFGTFASNVVMFFIILTTALTLHRNGMTDITTTREAAQALRPLAGDAAFVLFTVGIVGTGLLAVPTLAGSAAYAFAETFDWVYGLDQKLEDAVSFYVVFILAAAGGVLLDFLDVDPIRALYWSAVANGLLAPFLLVGVYLVAADKRIMLGQPNSLVTRVTVLLTIVLMFGCAVGMFAF